MAYFYNIIERYRITSRDGQTFDGHVEERPQRDGELWIYRDVVVQVPLEALRREYNKQIQADNPFSYQVKGVEHVATVVDAAAVVPVGAPLSLSDLEQRIRR